MRLDVNVIDDAVNLGKERGRECVENPMARFANWFKFFWFCVRVCVCVLRFASHRIFFEEEIYSNDKFNLIIEIIAFFRTLLLRASPFTSFTIDVFLFLPHRPIPIVVWSESNFAMKLQSFVGNRNWIELGLGRYWRDQLNHWTRERKIDGVEVWVQNVLDFRWNKSAEQSTRSRVRHLVCSDA